MLVRELQKKLASLLLTRLYRTTFSFENNTFLIDRYQE